jgi:exonuclease VII small subunit
VFANQVGSFEQRMRPAMRLSSEFARRFVKLERVFALFEHARQVICRCGQRPLDAHRL